MSNGPGFVISVPILRDEEVVERVIQLQPPLKERPKPAETGHLGGSRHGDPEGKKPWTLQMFRGK